MNEHEADFEAFLAAAADFESVDGEVRTTRHCSSVNTEDWASLQAALSAQSR